MDPSWHHHHYAPPPPGGAPPHATICPVCSSSHFPFCHPPYYPSGHQYPPPPPHPTDQFYPRPPPPPQPYHQPPPPASAAPYDPFADHRGGPAMNPNLIPAGPWSSNSVFDRDPYAQVYPGYDHGNAGAKRIRFDGLGFNSGQSGSYKNENPPKLPQVFSDDERRLRLIRDHGGAMNADRNTFEPLTEAGLKQMENSDSKFSNSSHSFNQNSNFDRGNNSLNLENHEMENLGQNYVKRNVEKGQSGYPQPQADISLKRKNVYENSHHGAKQSKGSLGSDQFHQKYGVPNQVGCMQNHYDAAYSNRQGFKIISGTGSGQDYQVFNGQPSLHAPTLPSLPVESPRPHFSEGVVSLSPSRSSVSLFPAPMASSSAPTSIYLPHSESSSSTGRGHIHASTGFRSEGFREIQQVPSTAYMSGNEFIPARSQSPEKHRVFHASHIIKSPHRASRPDHIVIILRGLPGSGKSYLAKLLRDLEVENGGSVPRIHSMDDYFMTEVEKVEATEVSKSSGSVRGKKQSTKSVLEYCYEPEMEEAYRSSMLKAFKKTLDEGVFSFVIVDDRNLRVADFAQFWAIAKRSGYEVYLLEAPYKDPVGCAARNVHKFTQEEVQKMADLWEEAPCMYFKLDIKSLLHGDASTESGIQEVDMDVEEGDPGCIPHGAVEENNEKLAVPHEGDLAFDGPENDQRLEGEADYAEENVKELGKSKWSNDLDEDNIRKTETVKAKSDSLSGLKQSYRKEGKSVRWGDEVGNSGFSIAAAKTVNIFSLVIGPGSGYTSKSNPLPEEEKMSASRHKGESKKQNIFQEQLRAEHESFKAAFDNRRQRLGGLNGTDD